MLVPFILGLISSLHCVGMCGPIAMMLPLTRSSSIADAKPGFAVLNPIVGAVLYNLGRVTTYAVFGLAFGMLGKSFAWFGWQQKLSIAMGTLILFVLLLPGLLLHNSGWTKPINKFMGRVRQQLGRLLFNGNPGSLYGIGILNGLLPCGMVYLAIAGAITAGDPLKGSAFMALFGLGTLPAMLGVSFFGSKIKASFSTGAVKLFPALMAVMAVLLILRGLNLDIPYVSPALHLTHSSPMDCHD